VLPRLKDKLGEAAVRERIERLRAAQARVQPQLDAAAAKFRAITESLDEIVATLKTSAAVDQECARVGLPSVAVTALGAAGQRYLDNLKIIDGNGDALWPPYRPIDPAMIGVVDTLMFGIGVGPSPRGMLSASGKVTVPRNTMPISSRKPSGDRTKCPAQQRIGEGKRCVRSAAKRFLGWGFAPLALRLAVVLGLSRRRQRGIRSPVLRRFIPGRDQSAVSRLTTNTDSWQP
jgi:hypothetical protein